MFIFMLHLDFSTRPFPRFPYRLSCIVRVQLLSLVPVFLETSMVVLLSVQRWCSLWPSICRWVLASGKLCVASASDLRSLLCRFPLAICPSDRQRLDFYRQGRFGYIVAGTILTSPFWLFSVPPSVRQIRFDLPVCTRGENISQCVSCSGICSPHAGF